MVLKMLISEGAKRVSKTKNSHMTWLLTLLAVYGFKKLQNDTQIRCKMFLI